MNNTVVRPPTTRASGGRTLIFLGILLALAAGTIVIAVISQYTSAPKSTQTVVVAVKEIPAGTLLTSGPGDSSHVAISSVFAARTEPADIVPAGAYVFTSQEALQSTLNNEVATSTVYAGEILRSNDPRLAAIGSTAAGSIDMVNPAVLKNGDVITSVQMTDKPVVVPGDYVDFMVTECNLPNVPGGCETQTTLRDVYVYAVRANLVYVVLPTQDALNMKYLIETGKVNLAVRRPGDSSMPSTNAVNAATVVKSFGY